MQAVPWSDMLKNAPKLADAAGKLWDSVASRKAAQGGRVSERLIAGETSLASVSQRVDTAESSIEALHDQLVSSLQVTAALAKQNSEMALALESLKSSVRLLVGSCVLIGLVAVTALVLLLRHPG